MGVLVALRGQVAQYLQYLNRYRAVDRVRQLACAVRFWW